MALPLDEFETIAFTAHHYLADKVVQLREQGQTGINPLMMRFLYELVEEYIDDRADVLPCLDTTHPISKSRLTADRRRV